MLLFPDFSQFPWSCNAYEPNRGQQNCSGLPHLKIHLVNRALDLMSAHDPKKRRFIGFILVRLLTGRDQLKRGLWGREYLMSKSLRTVPTNSMIFLHGLLNMREKQMLKSVIAIQKENWGYPRIFQR